MKRKYLTSWFKKNGPTLCTIGGCIGVGVTSILSVRAGMRTSTKIEAIHDNNVNNLWRIDDTTISIVEAEKMAKPTKKQIVLNCWKDYIPVVASGAATMLMIAGSDKLNKKTQAALASAYIGAKEYIRQLKTTLDANGINEIEAPDELFHECLDDFVAEDDEKHLFYYIYVKDDIGTRAGQYFESTIRDVVLSEYNINRSFILHGGVTLNETLDWFNIKRIGMGDVLGWDVCNEIGYQWLDFTHEKVTMDDGMECYIITTDFDATIPEE